MNQLAYYVNVINDRGDTVAFGPDDTVPAWAKKQITNPSAWADEIAPDAPDGLDDNKGDEGDGEPKPYSEWTKPELEAERVKRNEARDEADHIEVGGKGNKPDLVEALEADDAGDADA